MCQRKMVAIEICYSYVHVLKGGNEDVAKTDDLFCFSRVLASVSGKGGCLRFHVGDVSAISTLGMFFSTRPAC